MPTNHPGGACECGNYPLGPCRPNDCSLTPEDEQRSQEYWMLKIAGVNPEVTHGDDADG